MEKKKTSQSKDVEISIINKMIDQEKKERIVKSNNNNEYYITQFNPINKSNEFIYYYITNIQIINDGMILDDIIYDYLYEYELIDAGHYKTLEEARKYIHDNGGIKKINKKNEWIFINGVIDVWIKINR